MAEIHLGSGQLQILGAEGWEPVGELTHIGVDLAIGESWTVQLQAEHLCEAASVEVVEVIQLGEMRFCSGCGAWLDHPDAPR